MGNQYDNKWIRQIINLQHEDGSWGCFHSLSNPTKAQPMTTERALRRLYILGLTKDDEPIDIALRYMRECLSGKRRPPDRREKVLNWDMFEAHMLATWIRVFESDDPLALPIAQMWADIVARSFQNVVFDADAYAAEYRKHIPMLHKGERLIMLPQFYMVNLLKGLLDKEIENRFVDYIINRDKGIYYIYGARIVELPNLFASRQTSGYLAALEQLVGYSCAGEKLCFATEWLMSCRDENGEWDMGTSAKDGVYLPLSESWRKPEDRKRDCTVRIEKLLRRLK